MNSNQVELSDVMKVIEDLVNAKSSLFEKLKDLRVAVSQEKNPEIITAIVSLFGSDKVVDGKAYITFEMVTQCMRVVYKAGAAKASELIK
jgi:hypothetical protein